MRSVASVLIGGLAIGMLMPEMPAARLAPNAPTLIVALVVIPVMVGLTVQRRAWLASAAALLVGIATWVMLYLRPSPPWTPSDNWSVETWLMFVTAQVLPWTLVAALLGALGAWMKRAWMKRAWMKRVYR